MIEAIGAATGPEWQIGGLAQPGNAPAQGGGFAGALGGQLQQLSATQTEASQQSLALATGQASDPAEVVMAVERAQLAMQMAATLRNKGVEAVQELMRTTV